MIIEKIHTVNEAATLLNSHPATVRKLITDGHLKAYKKLNRWFILYSDLIKYIKDEPQSTPSEPANDRTAGNDTTTRTARTRKQERTEPPAD